MPNVAKKVWKVETITLRIIGIFVGMDTKCLRILEYLEPHGVGQLVDIAPVLRQFYPQVDKMNLNDVRSAWNTIYHTLEAMKDDTMIFPLAYPPIGQGNQLAGYNWIDSIGASDWSRLTSIPCSCKINRARSGVSFVAGSSMPKDPICA
jgi:hypothetical protein